jgi:hypothetical protein
MRTLYQAAVVALAFLSVAAMSPASTLTDAQIREAIIQQSLRTLQQSWRIRP